MKMNNVNGATGTVPKIPKYCHNKLELTYTPRAVNWSCFAVGMATVGLTTDWSIGPLFGALIASLHFCLRFSKVNVKEDSKP